MKNLSALDQDIRLAVVAPILFVLAVSVGLATVSGILLLTFLVMTLISAFTAYSPFYELFDIDHYRATA